MFPIRAACELVGGPLDGMTIESRIAEDPPQTVGMVHPDSPFGPQYDYRRVRRIGPSADGKRVRWRYEPALNREGNP